MLVLVQNYSDNRKQYGQHQNIWMQNTNNINSIYSVSSDHAQMIAIPPV